jgi:hypothetical protein
LIPFGQLLETMLHSLIALADLIHFDPQLRTVFDAGYCMAQGGGDPLQSGGLILEKDSSVIYVQPSRGAYDRGPTARNPQLDVAILRKAPKLSHP